MKDQPSFCQEGKVYRQLSFRRIECMEIILVKTEASSPTRKECWTCCMIGINSLFPVQISVGFLWRIKHRISPWWSDGLKRFFLHPGVKNEELPWSSRWVNFPNLYRPLETKDKLSFHAVQGPVTSSPPLIFFNYGLFSYSTSPAIGDVLLMLASRTISLRLGLLNTPPGFNTLPVLQEMIVTSGDSVSLSLSWKDSNLERFCQSVGGETLPLTFASACQSCLCSTSGNANWSGLICWTCFLGSWYTTVACFVWPDDLPCSTWSSFLFSFLCFPGFILCVYRCQCSGCSQIHCAWWCLGRIPAWLCNDFPEVLHWWQVIWYLISNHLPPLGGWSE